MIDEARGMGTEIKSRCARAMMALNTGKQIWNNSNISIKRKAIRIVPQVPDKDSRGIVTKGGW